MSAELREKAAKLYDTIIRELDQYDLNVGRIESAIRTERDTALAVVREYIVDNINVVTGPTGGWLVSPKQLLSTILLGIPAEQAALEAIKQQVRQAALESQNQLVERCLLLERSLINLTHLTETMKAVYSSQAAEWMMSKPAYLEARALLDNPSTPKTSPEERKGGAS